MCNFKKNKCILKTASALSSALVIMSCFGIGTVAGAEQKETASVIEQNGYSTYIASAQNFSKAQTAITLGHESVLENSAGITKGEDNIFWENKQGTLSYSFNIEEAGIYELKFNCLPDIKSTDDVWFGLKLDNEYPFEEAKELHLRRYWTNALEFPKDKSGNEYSPEQEPFGEYTIQSPYYSNQTDISPLRIKLSEGVHTLTLVAGDGGFSLKQVILDVSESSKKYNETYAEYKSKGYNEYTGEAIVIQGEKATLKNTRSLIPKFDNSAGMEPASPYIAKLNYIGSTNWKTPGETICWTVNAPKSGLYKVGIRYRQSDLENGISYRRLTVDGELPFKEADSIAFPYSLNWEFKELGEENPYLIYLSEGEHTLSLTVTMGDTAEYYNRLSEMVSVLGDRYIQIGMITGETPDANRDYDLFARIYDLEDTFKDLVKQLDGLADDMNSISGKRGSQYVAAVNNMSRILTSMLENPFTAQNYKSDYYTAYSSLCSWLSEMRSLPLDIDEIQIISPKDEFNSHNPSFFTSFKFGFQRLIYSFSSDYGSTGAFNESDGESLRIWVNWGRDQASILQAMIQETFTPKTGIKVRLDLVNASLVNGILSGNAPDCAMQMARTEPVNLAMRGALYDLTNFDDFKEVEAQFKESATEPYVYNGGVYALPDTQSFNVLFYRKDILEQLNINVPNDWTEFLEAAAVLQRNNMRAYIPYMRITASTTVNTGIGGLNMLPTFMLQNGLSLYNDEGNAGTLSETETIRVFNYWTDFYTKYKFPVEANFYNQFRIGTTPLGVSSYSLYTTLKVAAPELAGRWGIALLPGTPDSNGKLNRSSAGSGTGAAVLNISKNKKAAWEFIKWWVSADTQLTYSNNLEAILGEVGRHPTANLEAFAAMPWSSQDKKILTEQWNDVIEIPEVPGGYYLSRAVDQAFLEIVNGDKNSGIKDTLVKWDEVADNEIDRKINEYANKGE